VLALCLASPTVAQEPEGRFKYSGFGTLGLVWNSTGQAAFLRDVAQPSGATRTLDGRVDSRLGLQLDVQLAHSLQGTVQLISKYRYDGTYTPDFAWAFLGWTPVPELQVRAGRLGAELFMNADSRDVGYSYLWVRPPVECFGLIPITKMDGVDVTGTLAVGSGANLRIKAYYGEVAEKLPLAGSQPLDMYGDRIGGLIAEIQGGAWRGRLAYARFMVHRDFPPPIANLQTGLEGFAAYPGEGQLDQAAAALRFAGGTLQWYSAGLTYEEGPIQAQALLTHVDSDRIVMPASWEGFLSLGYRLGKVVPYGLWSRISSQHPQVPDLGALPGIPAAAPLVAGVENFVNANPDNQSTVAAGVRWNLLAKAALKCQVDRVQTRLPNSLWDQAQPGWNGRATVLSAALDFVF
jgi:hypothetical protein